MRKLDIKYIKKITTQVVGGNTIKGLKAEYGNSNCAARTVYKTLREKIETAVEKMSPETLGHICVFAKRMQMVFAFNQGAEEPFIQKTTTYDVLRTEMMFVATGESFLKNLAVVTIAAMARDLVMQDKWVREWRKKTSASE